MSLFKPVPDVKVPEWARRKASVNAQIAAAAKLKRRQARNRRNWSADENTPIKTTRRIICA